MARPKSAANLTPAELKQRKADLKTALKNVLSQKKEVEKAKKDTLAAAAAVEREQTKAADAAKKSADKAITAARKTAEAAAKRHERALEAAGKGIAKIEAQLAALEPTEA